MKRNQFITELKTNISNNDFLVLRTLYTPVIGKDAVMLFSLFFDYYNLSKNNNSFFSFNDLALTLGLTEDELHIERKKLEAVGLIRTFEKADNVHFIIRINQPLEASQFRANQLLFKSAIAKIGELMFERIEFSTKTKQLAKDDYQEVSAKYQDIFAIEEQPETKITSTLEMVLPSVKSKEEAISGLTSAQFIFFLTGAKVSPSQLTIIQNIQNNGFSSKSVNLIIDYSYEVNDNIVGNHIKKIAEDLLTKDLRDSQSIEKELIAARNSKKATIVKSPIASLESNDEMSNANWDDLFKSLGGGL